jgi:putative ABC transport system ATP-binding protein
LIELFNVQKSYGNVKVLNKVNLEVRSGEFISIRGRSGAGKTTLLRIMGLLEEPTCGELQLFGEDVGGLSDNKRSSLRLHSIGFVFQFFNLLPSLNIFENIELPLALAGVKKLERAKRVVELLKYFELIDLEARYPPTLSGGERQRVAVIRALVNNPKIILADEPTSSIDDENSVLLISLLGEINRDEQVTVVLTTTDLYEKLPSNKDYLLRKGQIDTVNLRQPNLLPL